MTPEQVAPAAVLFGLDDRPLWQQYLGYWQSIFTGDMGVSISRFPTPVTEVIGSQIGWTLLLGGTALIIAALIGNLLGILAAWRRGGFLDSVVPAPLVFIGSFPYFWLAMGALYLFGVSPRLVPAAPRLQRRTDSRRSRASSSPTSPCTWCCRRRRSSWCPSAAGCSHAQHDDHHHAEDYIVMAEAKGLSPSRIMLRYAARNATSPQSPTSAWRSASSSAAPCSPRSSSPTPAWATSCSRRSRASTTR